MSKETKVQNKVKYAAIKLLNDVSGWLFKSGMINSDGTVVRWGSDNMLPNKLYESYLNNVYHNTIINGTVDMIMGDGIELSPELENHIKSNMAVEYKKNNPQNLLAVNTLGEDLEDIVKQSLLDMLTIGTYTSELFFNDFDSISEHRYIDVCNCRIVEGRDYIKFYKNGVRNSGETVNLPLFNGEQDNKVRSIFMNYNPNSRTVYNLPYYFASLANIDLDKKINEYMHSSIDNGFSSFRILVYPGQPTEDEKDKLVSDFRETYTGPAGAKTMFMFKEGGEVPEIITVPDDNFDKKFQTLEETNNTKIFAGFRAQPVLFGILTKTTGFSEQEYIEAFKIYLNTVIKNFRNQVIRDFDYIYGIDRCFRFKPTELEESVKSVNQPNSI